jgi:hypothetical protein
MTFGSRHTTRSLSLSLSLAQYNVNDPRGSTRARARARTRTHAHNTRTHAHTAHTPHTAYTAYTAHRAHRHAPRSPRRVHRAHRAPALLSRSLALSRPFKQKIPSGHNQKSQKGQQCNISHPEGARSRHNANPANAYLRRAAQPGISSDNNSIREQQHDTDSRRPNTQFSAAATRLPRAHPEHATIARFISSAARRRLKMPRLPCRHFSSRLLRNFFIFRSRSRLLTLATSPLLATPSSPSSQRILFQSRRRLNVYDSQRTREL